MRLGTPWQCNVWGQEWCHKACTTRTALLHSVGVAPLRADGKFTVKLLSGGGRHRSRVTVALTGGCIPVQPVSCQSTTQITALQHAP